MPFTRWRHMQKASGLFFELFLIENADATLLLMLLSRVGHNLVFNLISGGKFSVFASLSSMMFIEGFDRKSS